MQPISHTSTVDHDKFEDYFGYKPELSIINGMKCQTYIEELNHITLTSRQKDLLPILAKLLQAHFKIYMRQVSVELESDVTYPSTMILIHLNNIMFGDEIKLDRKKRHKFQAPDLKWHERWPDLSIGNRLTVEFEGKDNWRQGFIQNAELLFAASNERTSDVEFGVVTDFTTWIFTKFIFNSTKLPHQFQFIKLSLNPKCSKSIFKLLVCLTRQLKLTKNYPEKDPFIICGMKRIQADYTKYI